MAMIYGLARRVGVWLGEASDDSALAFQMLRGTAGRAHTVAAEKATAVDEGDAEEFESLREDETE